MRMPMPGRSQRVLLPASIDEYVGPTHRVRVIVEVVDKIDLSAFGLGEAETGRPAYPPEALLSLLLYALSIGVFSSREMERRAQTDCAFMFATGGLQPSYRTIARFREDYSEALAGVFVKVLVVCRDVGLGDATVVAIDGTRQRANASLDAHSQREQLKAALGKARKHVDELLDAAARTDAREDAEPDRDDVRTELADARTRAAAIEEALGKLGDAEQANTTDPDARLQRTKEGSRPGYNAQIAVSGGDGVILACDVTTEPADNEQLLPMLTQTVENLGRSPGVILADSGYESGENVRALVERNQDALLASATARAARAAAKRTGRFPWTAFDYDPIKDEYICPAQQRLPRVRANTRLGKPASIYRGIACAGCPLRDRCTVGDRPRDLTLLETTPYLLAMSERRRIDRNGPRLFAQRAIMIEGHFGHFKHNLRWRHFWARGLMRCRSEFRLLCAAFNLMKLTSMRQRNAAA